MPRLMLRTFLLATCVLSCLALGPSGGPRVSQAEEAEKADAPLVLQMRRQVETAKGSGRFHSITEPVSWEPQKTAIVVCDMWDQHWCKGATTRVAEMAPRMNEVIQAARKRGVLIIHCPSSTLGAYEKTPQLRLANAAPAVETKVPLERWCRLDPAREGALPIDDSDGGCDCEPQCTMGSPWRKQIATIEIAADDAISDSATAYFLMKQRGIENVIVMGVHTNMCVLGRPFSIRQLIYQGQNVVLMRDMTDTMYNPRAKPFVSHFTGTDLVAEHIERNWCPTITSVDFLGGEPFRFKEDTRPHVVFLVSEDEYKTEQTLPKFAREHLGKEFRVSFVFGSETEKDTLVGLEALEKADVLFLSMRRRVLPTAQMETIVNYVKSGKPVIGIRTASHAFSARGNDPTPEGRLEWKLFDPEVLGGHYTGHHGVGPKVAITLGKDGADHPILEGVKVDGFVGYGSLYKVSPLAKFARPILIGTIPDQPAEPLAWTHATPSGGKVFYTSLGHPEDFDQPAFNRLLVNAIRWAAVPAAATSE